MKPDHVVELSAADLSPSGTVYCPHPKAHMVRWNTHPRVFFTLNPQGEARCPYCSTLYRVSDKAVLEQTLDEKTEGD